MKKMLVSLLLLLVLAPNVFAEGFMQADIDYPEFHVGVTGIKAVIKKTSVIVTGTYPHSPAEGKFKEGDVLLAVNKLSIEEPAGQTEWKPPGQGMACLDPRIPLGIAINVAEGKDGKMTFQVLRDGQKMDVIIWLKPIGSYSETWPLECKKSNAIIQQNAEFIVNNSDEDFGIEKACAGLFLLSTGDDKYLPVVKQFVESLDLNDVGRNTWYNGYRGVMIGEYYLKTGDKSVLPAWKALLDDARERQYYGGWNHWEETYPNYVLGGLMNPAGLQVLTSLILARESGIYEYDDTYDAALKYFYRFAGHGSVPYGDHHTTFYYGDNGKNGMLACGLSLLPGEKFTRASRVLAMAEVDSYQQAEQGHGGPFGNVMWRGIGGVHIPKDRQSHYRRHMDKRAWYYDLCRLPGGGFRILPSPPDAGGWVGEKPLYSSGMVGLTYTAPLRTLRITGMSRTAHSDEHRYTAVEEELKTTEFHNTGYAEGGGNEGLEPHEIYNKFPEMWRPPYNEDMSDAFYAKMMRHYSPVIRAYAARALGSRGDSALPEIIKAMQHADARVRHAGMDAISGRNFWGFAENDTGISPEVVGQKLVPLIVRSIKDPQSPMWEKVGALWAMGKADSKSVAANLPVILPFLENDEWYLRCAAWMAIRPLQEDAELIKPAIPHLLACFGSERHYYPHFHYAKFLQEIMDKQPGLADDICRGMAQAAGQVQIESGYRAIIGVELKLCAYREMNINKDPKRGLLIVDQFQEIYPLLYPDPSGEFMTGKMKDGWDCSFPGFIAVAKGLGEDGKPVIAMLKAILPTLRKRSEIRQQEDSMIRHLKDATARVEETIKEYEAKFGAVEVAPPATGLSAEK